MIMEMKYKWCEATLRKLPLLSEDEFVDRALHFARQNTSRRLREMLSEIDAGLRSGAMDEYDVYELLGTAEAEDPYLGMFEAKRNGCLVSSDGSDFGEAADCRSESSDS